VRERLADVSWDEAAHDVRPFIERIADVELLTLENVNRLLGEREG